MKRSVEVAIVGGGVIGCSIAYHLANLGCRDVAVYERGYPSCGSTGRCGAGVRAQWGTEMNCRLAHESIKRFERLEEDLDYPDIEFKQGGYLILAFSPAQLRQFERNVALQNSLGIPSRVVGPDEARDIVPHLAAPDLVGATFCGTDGHCNPFKVTDAYARAARRLGVEINTYTSVTGFEQQGGRVVRLETTAGPVECGAVVNAAGPFSAQVAAMAGLELPVFSQRHQVVVTEPVAPKQRPMVISFAHGFYCQQTPHGSFILGLGDPAEPRGLDIGHSWQFLADLAEKVEHLLPSLGRLRAVRQWSGLYNVTPDAQPILGPAGQPANLWLAVGFSGHGFMLAPMVGLTIAQGILGMEAEIPIDRLVLARFARGELVPEPSVV
ncbi:MAG: FAD-binding oxidoreductase [Bacillota bacterium]|nr:FAD-binding oxidoreductase [Bacillota bacterium]